ncbi:MAG TPA: hypothetical protein VIQ74_11675 [Gemmatimonadaceae bacterium]
MLVEQCTVSRKTPLDGKLEITSGAAQRLVPLGARIPLTGAGGDDTAELSSLECTCEKGAGSRHVHHFIQSAALRTLTPGSVVRLELDEGAGRVRIEAEP